MFINFCLCVRLEGESAVRFLLKRKVVIVSALGLVAVVAHQQPQGRVFEEQGCVEARIFLLQLELAASTPAKRLWTNSGPRTSSRKKRKKKFLKSQRTKRPKGGEERGISTGGWSAFAKEERKTDCRAREPRIWT